MQKALVDQLGLAAHRVRVVTPDVGGGFGTKCSIYPEDILIPVVATRLGRSRQVGGDASRSISRARPIRGSSSMTSGSPRRVMGSSSALDDRFLLDQGVYTPWGIVQPYNTVGHMLGPFRVPHARFEGKSVVTNKTPHAPYRGAGRPEAVFVMDRMVDRLARTVGIDPAEVRRRNFIRIDEMPYDVGMLYRDGNPLVYDGGTSTPPLRQRLKLLVTGRSAASRRRFGVAECFEGSGSPRTWRNRHRPLRGRRGPARPFGEGAGVHGRLLAGPGTRDGLRADRGRCARRDARRRHHRGWRHGGDSLRHRVPSPAAAW